MPAAVDEEKEVTAVSSLDSVPVDITMADAAMTVVPTIDVRTSDLLATDVCRTDAPVADALVTDVPMTDVPATDLSMADDDVPMTDMSIVDTSVIDVPGTETMTAPDTTATDALASDLCEVSLDVPDSVETVVVSTSNCVAGSSPGDVALSEAVTTVLGEDVTVGPLPSGGDNVAIPDTSDALAAVVDSEPAAVETVISTDLPPVASPSASVATSATGSPGDRRFVRFNNRDLESLRKLQDELNVRKAGGVPPRGPGSPIVIRAELASPQKGLSTQAPQLLVVQKPSPGASPKKADIRVIHPPGITVRRQLQMGVPTSVATSTAGGLTKVILQPAGQLVGGTTFQLVGAVSGSGGQTAQPTLVLSSPNRATPVRAPGTQLVRVAAPGTTSVSGPKGMYVVSPMKLGGKVAMIPINVGKSPQRIAPAPMTSTVTTGLPVAASRVTLAATSSASGATPVRPAAPTTTIVPVPGKMNVLLKPSGPGNIPPMGNSAMRHVLVISTAPSVRKTPYPTRGRRSKHTSAGRSTHHRPIAPHPPRLAPIAPAIPRVVFTPEVGQPVPRPATVAAVVQSSISTAVAATTGTTTLVTAASSSSSSTVQVPGGKFHYVRLVTAPAATTQASSTVLAAAKPSTLVPVSTARPLAPATSVPSSTAGGTLPAGVRLTVPIAPAISSHQGATAAVPVSSAHRVLIPAASASVRPSLPTGQLGSLPTATLISAGGGPMQNAFVVVPAQYVAQFQQSTQPSPSTGTSRVVFQTGNLLGPSGGFVPIAAATSAASTAPTTASVSAGPDHREPPLAPPPPKAHHINGTSFEDNSRPRKPCNCTKSQCLKLYCDCFANGEFCHSCNCNNCFNNLEHEEERQKAIGACLERNPNAFRPKIGKGKEGDLERRHTKGCNCKRSGCLKNYCECYEAKILCSSMCKCVGCKNFEDSSERKTLMQLADAAEVRVQQQAAARTKMSACDLPLRPPPISETGERLPFAFITQEVVEATCQCLLARADESDRLKKPYGDVERSVLEEFGRCLEAIIDSAHRTRGKPTATAAAADTVEKKATPVVCAPPPPPPPPPPERTASRRTKTARRMLNL
ncbi:uncharacterized protein LOC144154952 isoform X2 [Haemaphysalis longicornis]